MQDAVSFLVLYRLQGFRYRRENECISGLSDRISMPANVVVANFFVNTHFSTCSEPKIHSRTVMNLGAINKEINCGKYCKCYPRNVYFLRYCAQ